MSARVTRKRARTSSVVDDSDTQDHATQGEIQPAAESVARTRDEEFWYSDGNVILVARDVEFRVYKGLLADHSPVFRDMFSLPQAPGASSSTATLAEVPCPVVHVSDSPEDLRHMLRAYMPRGGPNVFFRSTPHYTYHTVSAAVRLGHKYQMPGLLDDALDFLNTYYPTDFDEWRDVDGYGPPTFELENAIGVVNLARLVDDAGLLLMALLSCCMIDDAETMIRGFLREDGTREQLTLDDIGLCYAAKSLLLQESTKVTLRVCRPEVSATCKTPENCTRRFKNALQELEDTETLVAEPDACMRVTTIEDLLERGDPRLCRHCRKMVEDRDLRERKAAWKKLPEVFGIELPPGEDIEAGQANGNAAGP